MEIDNHGVIFVPLAKNILEVIFGEDPDADRAATQFAELHRYTQDHKDVRLLVDYTRVKRLGAPVEQVIRRAVRDIVSDRAASYGASVELSKSREGWYASAGKSDRARNFDSREDALAWLSEGRI